MNAAIIKLSEKREALKRHIASEKARHKACADAEARHKMLTLKQLRLEVRQENGELDHV